MKRFALFFFIFINFGFAKEKIFIPNKDVPAELSQIAHDVQILIDDKDERGNFEAIVQEIDNALSNLTKREAFMLSKSVIYRGLLINHPNETIENFYESKAVLKSLQKASKKFTMPLIKWLYHVVFSDFQILFKSSFYNQYKKYRKLPNVKPNIEILKIERKLKFLAPWSKFLIESSFEKVNSFTKELCFKLLKQFIFESSLFFKYSQFSTVNLERVLEDFKFFTVGYGDLKKSGTKTKSLEDILDPVFKMHKEEGLPLPIDDWSPEEGQEKTATPIPPSTNYKTPDTLPIPTDDWILEDF